MRRILTGWCVKCAGILVIAGTTIISKRAAPPSPSPSLHACVHCRGKVAPERGLLPHVKEAVMKLVMCGVHKKADMLERLRTEKVRPCCHACKLLISCFL